MKGKRSQARVITRSSGLKTITRSIWRHSRSSIARQAMSDDKIRGCILQQLTRIIQREMKAMSKVKTGKYIYIVCVRDVRAILVTVLLTRVCDVHIHVLFSVTPPWLQ